MFLFSLHLFYQFVVASLMPHLYFVFGEKRMGGNDEADDISPFTFACMLCNNYYLNAYIEGNEIGEKKSLYCQCRGTGRIEFSLKVKYSSEMGYIFNIFDIIVLLKYNKVYIAEQQCLSQP